MKFKKLLVLSALWLVGLNANAVLTLEREKPVEPSPIVDLSTIERTPAEFQVGTYYVLYNVGTEKFYFEGNAWGTQATVSADDALLLYFALPSGKTLADKQLYLRDYPKSKNKWHTAFLAKDGKVTGQGYPAGLFVDNNDGEAALVWVEAIEGKDKTYHFSVSEANSVLKPEGKFFGVVPDSPGVEGGETGTVIHPQAADDGVNAVEWQFFEVPEWSEYGKLAAVYNASEELRKLIESAPNGFDLTPYENVYNNEDATAEQLQQAKADLEAALKNSVLAQLGQATGENPVDVTELIVNPDFVGASVDGWTFAVGSAGWGYPAETQKLAEVPEFYQSNYNMYQELDIAGGVFELRMNGFYRAGNTDDSYKNYVAGTEQNGFLYAGTDVDTLKVPIMNSFKDGSTYSISSEEASSNGIYVPNSPTAAKNYFDKGHYQNVLFFDGNDSKLRIGIIKEKTIDADWTTFDRFRLKYYGKGADAYQAWAKGGYQTIDTEAEGFLGTKAVAEAFNAQVAAATATNREEAMATMAQLEAAYAVVQENLSAWGELKTLYDEVKDFMEKNADNDAEAVKTLKAYLGSGRSGLQREMSKMEMSTEEVKEAIAKLQELYDAAKQAKPVVGADVTYKLNNPDFSKGNWDGWTRTAAAGGNVAVNNSCGEAWNNASFDIRQEVPNMAVGVYEISAQGFYRYLRGDNAWNAWQTQESEYVKSSPCFIYMNDNMTPFVNIFSEPILESENIYSGDYNTFVGTDAEGNEVRYVFPNNMADAAAAFAKGMFTQSAFGAVTNAEDIMKLGVKGSSNQGGDSWVIFDNFTLTYWGTQAEKVNEALKAAIAECTAKLETVESAMAKRKLEAALADAEAAVDGTDGDAMFQVLAELYAAKNFEYEIKQKETELKDAIAALSTVLTAHASDELLEIITMEYEQKLDLYNDSISNGEDISFESATATVKNMTDEYNKYLELEEAYNTLQTAIENAEAGEEAWAANAEVVLTAVQTKLGAGTAALPVEAIDAEIEKIEGALTARRAPDADMSKATDNDPVDATSYIESAKFEKADFNDDGEDILVNTIDGWKRNSGWTDEQWNANPCRAFGVDANQRAALACEFWNTTFDIYQTLVGIPNGTYEIQCNGFAQYSDYKTYVADPSAPTNTFLYAISAQDTAAVAVSSIFSGVSAEKLAADSLPDLVKGGDAKYVPGEGVVTLANAEDATKTDTVGYIPSSMVAAVKYFEAGKYQNSVVLKVTDGKLTFGVKCPTQEWSVFDNFKLIYYGDNSEKQNSDNAMGIDLIDAEAPVVRTEFFSLNGVRTLAPQKGVSIMRQTLSNGVVIVKKIRN